MDWYNSQSLDFQFKLTELSQKHGTSSLQNTLQSARFPFPINQNTLKLAKDLWECEKPGLRLREQNVKS